MPLTWNITRCAERPETLNAGVDGTVTEAIIFLTMGTGIGDLSEANAAEFYGRVHLMEAIYGPMVRVPGPGGLTDRPITPEDIRRRIGLRTNVGKVETRASFLKRHCTAVVSDAVWQYQSAERKRIAAEAAADDEITREGAALAAAGMV
jgi:hypothetical protein